VPAELDAAIRVCLQLDPERRYESALEMAEALEAGRQGEAAAATRLLAAGADPTAAMDDTAATRALRTRAQPRPAPMPAPPTPAPPARRPGRERERALRRRRINAFFALLAVLAAIAAVAIALLAAEDANVEPVDQTDVQEQIQGIRDLIREHTP
jgi:hypothetical protein